jgi:flagellar basal body rod protein FlgG
MIRGFYTALSGIVDSMTRQAIVSDNIANANTVGFKETLAGEAQWGFSVAASTGGPSGFIGTGAYATDPRLDLSGGVTKQTDVPTDLTLQGDGLFAVRTASGAIAYTRAGSFTLDLNGHLVTPEGNRVLDVTGNPVVVPGGASALTVLPDGTIAETGQRIAVLGIPTEGLSRLGSSLFVPNGPVSLISPTVAQGALEQSNTDLGGAMTELILLQRSLQLSSRALSIQEQTLGDATSIGRIR